MLSLDKSTWTTHRLGDIATPSKEKVYPTEGTVERFVAGEHMDSNELRIRRWGNVGDGYLGPAFHRHFHPGQILYGSRRTYLRKVAVADFDGVCANTTFVLDPVEEKVSRRFLPFLMCSEPFHAFAISESRGSVNPYVNWSDIARFEATIPSSLEEQEHIADLLWSIERHSAVVFDAIQAVQGVREKVEVETLSRPDAPVFLFRELWSKNPESGYSTQTAAQSTGYDVLTLAALGPAGYRTGCFKPVPDSPKTRRAATRPGDLLISRANTVETVGRAGIVAEDRLGLSFPDTMMRIHLVPGISPKFIVGLINSPVGRRYMEQVAAGTNRSMAKINRTSLGKFPVPKWSLAEQEAWVHRLDHYTSVEASLEREAFQLRTIRESCLVEIFGDKA